MGWIVLMGLLIFVPAILILIYTASASQSRFQREMDRLAVVADDQRRNLDRQEEVLDRAERLLDRLETRPSEPIDDSIRTRE